MCLLVLWAMDDGVWRGGGCLTLVLDRFGSGRMRNKIVVGEGYQCLYTGHLPALSVR